MSNNQQRKIMSRLNRHFLRSLKRWPNRLMASLLRLLFVSNRLSRSGFVLPTAVLLILMLTLTVGALSFRSFSRVEQTIAFREQQIVDGFAAPAVDRAKAKLEYLFTQDQAVVDKRPPSSDDLVTAVLVNAALGDADAHVPADAYTLPDEIQLDINGDGDPDPAWSFNSQGTTVVYSLLMSHEANTGTGTVSLTDDDDELKAEYLVTRNGPINTQSPATGCPVATFSGDGWQDAGGNIQKNFQVNVLAISNSGGPNRTVSAAEYQQVRSSPKGSKYGAWFRYDLEVFPGEVFRWNGAMHSESNLIASSNLQAYLVSSSSSCIYSDDSSDITITESQDDNGDNIPDGFKGQVVSGASKTDTLSNTSPTVNFHTQPLTLVSGVPTPGTSDLKLSSDSITNVASPKVSDIAVNPVGIFTQDVSANFDDSTWNPATATKNSTYLGARVQNISDATRPFLDDGFRADNRYGPKPVYNSLHSLTEVDDVLLTTPHKIGEEITDNAALTEDNAATQEYGLDGYWERRAVATGLRVVVGQRLELGNLYGWGADDPLYPPEAEFGANTNTSGQLINNSSTVIKGAAETKQQKSLRDNLAAVQGMVVYHYDHEAGELPYMCMASTVHAGTQQSLINSRTFNQYDETGEWEINFLEGKGTNGWEFDFPYTADDFLGGEPLGDALRNLAYFAGDPLGGAPSFPPVQGIESDTTGDDAEFVHPYPYLSMWGDFSVLRRIFDSYAVNTTSEYNALSPADKSTLHSAACSLGMLAYNLESLQGEYDAIETASGSASINALGVQIAQLMDGQANSGNQEIGTTATNICTSLGVTGCPTSTYDPNYYAQFTAEDWVNALENSGALGANLPTAVARAEVIGKLQQILRDRTMGFIPAQESVGLPGTGTGYTAAAGTFEYQGNQNPFKDKTFKVGCDPTGFAVSGGNSDQAQLGLAMAFCSTAEGPKYPALHYIFPVTDHNYIDSDNTAYRQPYDDNVYGSGTKDELFTEGDAATSYVLQINKGADATSVTDDTISGGRNSTVTFQAVDPADIALTPATDVNSATNGFKQPYSSATALSSRDDLQKNIVNANGTFYDLAFLDKAMMDGRELMNVRVLDLDIDKLTSDKPFASNTVAWISESDGLFYAAREDAVREDMIVRPRRSAATWAICQDFFNLINDTANRSDATNAPKCPMDILPTAKNQLGTYDPPLNSDNSISPKPVDMYADPDRRPYGFRLINGSNLNRSDDDRAAGLTFVTDNSAYILGDFNLHQDKDSITDPPTILEEFQGTDVLGDAFATETNETTAKANFYGRDDLNFDFAAGDRDAWRPSEIFADAITILSENFRDGWIEEAFRVQKGTGKGSPIVASSYLNYNRPFMSAAKTAKAWQREDKKTADGSATADSDLTPIRFDRNAIAYKSSETAASTNYQAFPKNFSGTHASFYDSVSDLITRRQNDEIKAASPTRVNALLVAGIVPMRAKQNYGGFHNFPRLLEYWADNAASGSPDNDSSLIISGGFYQLNFSTQATAPFDQDAWEPGTMPDTNIVSNSQTVTNHFYGAPLRVWGYDVGFQYTSVSPIARRFVTLGRPRSEFYRELPLDDAYIQQLCASLQTIETNTSCQ